jgi:hypothetical protein
VSTNKGTIDIDVDQISGVAIVATTERLTPRCRSASEIDAHVSSLKEELDTAAQRAKDALWGMKDLPDFPKDPH